MPIIGILKINLSKYSDTCGPVWLCKELMGEMHNAHSSDIEKTAAEKFANERNVLPLEMYFYQLVHRREEAIKKQLEEFKVTFFR